MSEATLATRRGLAIHLSFTPAVAEYLDGIRIRANKKTREELLCEALRHLAREHGFDVPDESVTLKVPETSSARPASDLYIKIALFYDEEHHWPQRLMAKLDCDEADVVRIAIGTYEQKLEKRTLQ
jgi:hypothetical protein